MTLHAASGPIAVGGAPVAGQNAGAFRVTPDGELVRMWREGGSWQCRPIFTWGPLPAPESLIAGGNGTVFGVNGEGALFNTYFEGPLSRYAPLQHPFALQPRSLALGGETGSDTGVFGVTHDGRLARARWTGRPAWEFTIIPSWGPKIVPGSLISGDARIYGVNEAGQLINTWMDKGVMTFAVIEGRNDFVPGSIALGGTPSRHSSVYSVSRSGQLVRAWWDNGWKFDSAAVDGGLTPFLISGLDGVYGVNGKGQLVQGSVANGTIQVAVIGTATGLAAGSLSLAGPPAANNDIYAVDGQGRLVRTSFASGVTFRGQNLAGGWRSAVVAGVTVQPKSLVAAGGGVYGLDTTGRPFAVVTANDAPSVVYPCPIASPGTGQRRAHARVLQTFGITDLSTLGTLNISGSVVPSAGLLRPRTDLVAGTTAIKAARRANTGTRQFEPLVIANASVLKSEPFPAPPANAKMDVQFDVAYIAAKTIHLANDTNIILKFPNRKLFLIAEQLIVGSNVTVTYERQNATPPSAPATSGKPGTPAVPDPFSSGRRGGDGGAGTNGSAGWSFTDSPAPEIEVWVLSMTGSPSFDLRGQDGGAGGAGGNGAEGGNGSAGSPSVGNFLNCNHGPGNGGDGGNGGRAGNGGQGGDGAPGGRLSLYAPASVIAAYVNNGFFITVDGGSAGPGGIPGTPGAGGAGGPVGTVNGSACNKPAATRVAGSGGAQGAAGTQGAAGKAGLPQTPDPVRMLAIQQSDFVVAWEKPAIEHIDVPGPQNGRAYEGQTITVHGERFTSGDTILVEKAPNQWLPAVTQWMGDKLLAFVVPQVTGGLHSILVEQAGTAKQSNKLSLFVLPKLVSTNPQPRIRPGDEVFVNGTGFAPNMRVFLNDQESGKLTYVDEHTYKYLVIRPPAGIPPNPAGEPANLVLRLADGTSTAPLGVILDTYQIEVLGDSIAWDVGLQETLKYSGLVEQKVRSLNQASNIGIYRRTPAHTGAILGAGSRLPAQAGLPAIHGEVPTESPTVSEMLDVYAADPNSAHVELVLMTACINDIGIFTMLDPQVSVASLGAKVTASCHDDLLKVLNRTAQVFPSAKIVTTSYFAPLSPMSDGAGLVAFLIAIDHPLVKIPGEVVNGFLKPGTRARVIENSMFFGQKSTEEIGRAVTDANAALGGAPRVFFADAKFAPQNAALAGSQAWLFGVNLDLSPQDLLAPTRKTLCEQFKSRTEKPICVRASAGHPNVAGAQQYANAIFPFL